MPDRDASRILLNKWIENENLRHHCEMVAMAMQAYASELDKPAETVEEWWTAGLLHDLDWEKYPDEHPNKVVNDVLPQLGYSTSVIEAIKAHAPERTGKEPETEIERYLFACDELSGFMNAVALMRPNKFSDMKVKSVKKKLKDRKFAENVPRKDIDKGADLIMTELSDHIQFLISVFKEL